MNRNSPLVAKTRRAVQELGLSGRKLLLAVSGGPDSVAMLLALSQIALPDQLFLQIASIDHGLREESALDCEFVEHLAQKLGVACTVRKVVVEGGQGLEANARRARYRALREIAARQQADFIATGHTLEDQVETVLLRLARGAGIRGLRGILAQRGNIVRPMLEVSRAEINQFLAEHQISARQDSSNGSLAFARNRVRHLVLPALVQALGVPSLKTIARSTAVALDDERLLQRWARRRARRILVRKDEKQTVEGQVGDLLALTRAMRWRILRLAARDQGLPLAVSHLHHLERALKIAGPNRVTLPKGFEFKVEYRRFSLSPATTDPRPRPGYEYLIPGPGSHSFPEAEVHVETVNGPGRASPGSIRIDPAAVALPLILRTRKPADQFRPAAGHKKKLKAFLIDQKIPRERRARLPLLVDSRNQVLWIVGVRASQAAAQGELTDQSWQITIKASVG